MIDKVTVLQKLKAAYKEWDSYEPEWMLDSNGGLNKNDETLYHFDDLEATFLDGFMAGIEYAKGLKND